MIKGATNIGPTPVVRCATQGRHIHGPYSTVRWRGMRIKGDTNLGPTQQWLGEVCKSRETHTWAQLNSEMKRCADQERHKLKQDFVNVKNYSYCQTLFWYRLRLPETPRTMFRSDQGRHKLRSCSTVIWGGVRFKETHTWAPLKGEMERCEDQGRHNLRSYSTVMWGILKIKGGLNVGQ